METGSRFHPPRRWSLPTPLLVYNVKAQFLLTYVTLTTYTWGKNLAISKTVKVAVQQNEYPSKASDWALQLKTKDNDTKAYYCHIHRVACCAKKAFILCSSSFFTLSGTRALPFGVISATRSSTVTCSNPFSLITSLQCAFNWSFHPHSISLALSNSFRRSLLVVNRSWQFSA